MCLWTSIWHKYEQNCSSTAKPTLENIKHGQFHRAVPCHKTLLCLREFLWQCLKPLLKMPEWKIFFFPPSFYFSQGFFFIFFSFFVFSKTTSCVTDMHCQFCKHHSLQTSCKNWKQLLMRSTGGKTDCSFSPLLQFEKSCWRAAEAEGSTLRSVTVASSKLWAIKKQDRSKQTGQVLRSPKWRAIPNTVMCLLWTNIRLC